MTRLVDSFFGAYLCGRTYPPLRLSLYTLHSLTLLRESVRRSVVVRSVRFKSSWEFRARGVSVPVRCGGAL